MNGSTLLFEGIAKSEIFAAGYMLPMEKKTQIYRHDGTGKLYRVVPGNMTHTEMVTPEKAFEIVCSMGIDPNKAMEELFINDNCY